MIHVFNDDNFAYFFIKTHVVGSHKNRLTKAILMSIHNTGFYEDLTKNIFQLSSNIIKYKTDFLIKA